MAGVLDADFRGKVIVLMVNHGSEVVTLAVGDRVAQLVLERCSQAGARFVAELPPAVGNRGMNGFGSTGLAEPSQRAVDLPGAPSEPVGVPVVTRVLDFEVTATEPVRRTKPFGHDGGKLGLQRRLAELLCRVTPPQSWLRHLARPDRWATLPNRDGVAYSFLRATESAFSLHGRLDVGSHLPEREVRRIRDPENVWRAS